MARWHLTLRHTFLCPRVFGPAAGGVLVPVGRQKPRQEDDPLFVRLGKSEAEYFRDLGGGVLVGKGKKASKKAMKPDADAPMESEEERLERLRDQARRLSKQSRTPSILHDECVVYREDQVVIRYLCKVRVSY